MKPIRILEYITASSLGGAEHAALAIGSELHKNGHQLLFLSPRGRRLTAVIQERGFPLWAPKTYGKVDPLTLYRVVRLIRALEIQVVHTHLSTASLLGSLAARICRVPSVAMVQGLNSAFCYRFATRVVAVSEAVRRHLVNQGLPSERIRVIHNAIDVDHFQDLPDRDQARASLGLAPEDKVVLYAGRLSPEKGVALLPSIMERLWNDVPGARLVVLGDGMLREELRREIYERRLDSIISLVGFRSDTRPLLAAADLLLLPSFTEGLPLALIEGMAAGLPSVGTDAGGIPEAIAPGKTGEIAPVGDVDALARACAAILKDRGRQQTMSAEARTRVRTLFSIQRNVSELEVVFMEAMGSPLPRTVAGSRSS